MKTRQQVPGLAHTLAVCIAPKNMRGPITGDLEEEFVRQVQSRGLSVARRGYWAQVIWSIAPLLTSRIFHGDGVRIFAFTVIGYVMLVLWGSTINIAISNMAGGTEADPVTLIISIPVLVARVAGTVALGLIIGRIYPTVRMKMRTSVNAIIWMLSTIVALPGIIFSFAFPELYTDQFQIIWLFAVPPGLFTGAYLGMRLRRRA